MAQRQSQLKSLLSESAWGSLHCLRNLSHGRLHWIIYLPALIFLTVSLLSFFFAIGHRYEIQIGWQLLRILFAVIAIVLAVAAWFNQWITEIAVTNQRVIYKRGFIWRRTAEMNMNNVESVIVTQSILGRMLDYGSIHVRGTGEGIERLHKISSPIELRNCITAR